MLKSHGKTLVHGGFITAFFTGLLWLRTIPLPLMPTLYPGDLAQLLTGFFLFILISKYRLVCALLMSLSFIGLGYYFSADEIMSRFDLLKDNHLWLQWRSHIGPEKHLASRIFYGEAFLCFSYGLFLWKTTPTKTRFS